LPLYHTTDTVCVGWLYRTMGVVVGPGSLVKTLYVLLTLGFTGQVATASVALRLPEKVPTCCFTYFSLAVIKLEILD